MDSKPHMRLFFHLPTASEGAEMQTVPTWVSTLSRSMVFPTCADPEPCPERWLQPPGASTGSDLQNPALLQSRVSGAVLPYFGVTIYFSKAPENKPERMPQARTAGCRGPAAERIRVL